LILDHHRSDDQGFIDGRFDLGVGEGFLQLVGLILFFSYYKYNMIIALGDEYIFKGAYRNFMEIYNYINLLRQYKIIHKKVCSSVKLANQIRNYRLESHTPNRLFKFPGSLSTILSFWIFCEGQTSLLPALPHKQNILLNRKELW
jgi:hypothetical protein